MVDDETYELGNVRLSIGQTLRDAKLAYKTYGTLPSNSQDPVDEDLIFS